MDDAWNPVDFSPKIQPPDDWAVVNHIPTGVSRADAAFARNRAFVRSGVDPATFNTKLTAPDESQFQNWVNRNHVPFDQHADTSDYDMRGFWKALQSGDPKAQSAVNPNDSQLHYPDYWKTPYHETFSVQSQWANPATAPNWNDQDQLVAPDGTVLFDERALQKRAPQDGVNGPQ